MSIKGPKEKKERALGVNLGLKAYRSQSPKSGVVRRPYRPGAHGQSRRRKQLSDFGRQIQEKKKFKLTYGVDEKNLKQLFATASKFAGSVSGKLMELLERRLDNALYRSGLAPSRGVARQLVLHGHITVNKKRVRSPGFQVSIDDVIAVYPSSQTTGAFKEVKEALKKQQVPEWLTVDPESVQVKVVHLPQDVEPLFEINLLVESFSK